MNLNAFIENQKKFNALLDGSPDLLSLVVKSHYSIDKLLDFVIFLRIPKADAIELRRVAFLLKVDLATGMGLFREDLRPIFNLINTLRNRFAHDPYSAFSDKDMQNAKNVLLSRKPMVVPESFKSETVSRIVLETLFVVGFLNAVAAYEIACRENAERRITNEMVIETLSNRSKGRKLGLSVKDEFSLRLREFMAEHHPEIGQERDNGD
ncbi:hypothetical protein ACTOWA_12290 [Herbaspirillum seropedicae]|uniref:hypothetical protein n=1 Tax=Herbaspirillum seropedicae TaxID=964 RepID=UPI003F8D0E6D